MLLGPLLFGFRRFSALYKVIDDITQCPENI